MNVSSRRWCDGLDGSEEETGLHEEKEVECLCRWPWGVRTRLPHRLVLRAGAVSVRAAVWPAKGRQAPFGQTWRESPACRSSCVRGRRARWHAQEEGVESAALRARAAEAGPREGTCGSF